MNRPFLLSVLLAWLAATQPAHADPIHAVADGAYWHHDSGWVFPAEIAEFTRVGIPQDVAGSKDAVGYYACVVGGARIVASVDVYPAISDAAASMAESAGELEAETPFVTRTEQPLTGTRRIFRAGAQNSLTVLYFVSAGEWRVRIRVADANAALLPLLDLFANRQQWTSLSGAPTPR